MSKDHNSVPSLPPRFICNLLNGTIAVTATATDFNGRDADKPTEGRTNGFGLRSKEMRITSVIPSRKEFERGPSPLWDRTTRCPSFQL